MKVLRGGLVVDGTGAAPRIADVVLDADIIHAVTEPSAAPVSPDDEVVDCAGLVVSPGFVDIHTHSDLTRLEYPGADTRILQGVTTEVVGNCGMSPFPVTAEVSRLRGVISTIDVCPDVAIDWTDLAGYRARLEATPAATNVGLLMGHGSLREYVTASGEDPATEAGRALMVAELQRALDLGVLGLSLGLMYPPGELAENAELVGLAEVVAGADALLTSHMRSYHAEELADAVAEMVELTVRTGVRLQLSHLRSLRDTDARGISAALARLDAAPDVVEADIYPYLAGHTTALQMFPPGLRAAGADAAMAEAARDPESVIDQLRIHIGDPARVTLAKAPRAEYVGARLDEAAARAGADWGALLLDLFVEADGNLDVIVVGSTPEDMMAALTHPRVAIASDGVALSVEHSANLPHPRSIGAFPRAIRALLDAGIALEAAVHKATGQPASRIGVTDRGRISPGSGADLVVFDPDRIDAPATYAEPLLVPVGIARVLVNGETVVVDGRPTGARPGRLVGRS